MKEVQEGARRGPRTLQDRKKTSARLRPSNPHAAGVTHAASVLFPQCSALGEQRTNLDRRVTRRGSECVALVFYTYTILGGKHGNSMLSLGLQWVRKTTRAGILERSVRESRPGHIEE